jgi:hypothetical protein
LAPDDPWPPVPVKRYEALINYETGSMRQEMIRELGATMPRGGGVPFMGELSQIMVISGDNVRAESVTHVSAPCARIVVASVELDPLRVSPRAWRF